MGAREVKTALPFDTCPKIRNCTLFEMSWQNDTQMSPFGIQNVWFFNIKTVWDMPRGRRGPIATASPDEARFRTRLQVHLDRLWLVRGGGLPGDLDPPIEGDQGEPTGRNLTASWPRWGRRIKNIHKYKVLGLQDGPPGANKSCFIGLRWCLGYFEKKRS